MTPKEADFWSRAWTVSARPIQKAKSVLALRFAWWWNRIISSTLSICRMNKSLSAGARIHTDNTFTANSTSRIDYRLIPARWCAFANALVQTIAKSCWIDDSGRTHHQDHLPAFAANNQCGHHCTRQGSRVPDWREVVSQSTCCSGAAS